MANLSEVAVVIAKRGPDEWVLRLEDDETLQLRIDEVDREALETRGFYAHGRDEEAGLEYELSTGQQPGGPVTLYRRAFGEEEWEEVGEVVDAHDASSG
ncbi:hypothetical protein ACFQJD_12560 [Haloplanus sp. GCM10025708]|uniref:hypothetical protein n=1 Tax=Haloferacaceae TaxID=1644056 RepID=UPI003623CDEF